MPVQQQDDLKQTVGQALAEQAVAIRDRRRLIEQRWLRSRRVWMNFELDRRYAGSDTTTSNYNIPAARKAAERTIVRGVRMLTPNVKWFEVAAMGDHVSDSKLSNVDKYMWYVLRKRIKSRTIISQLVRCALMYGLCHLKTSVMVRNGQVWPAQRVVDPFAYYTFPETASTVDEAEVVFEDYLLSYEKYKTWVARNIVEAVDRSELVKPDWPYHLVERLAYQGITDPTANVDISLQISKTSEQLEKTTAGFASITEMWINREDKLYQVYILWNHKDGAKCVGFFQSLYDQPLYRSMIHRSLPGELYTNSMLSDIDEMDTIQNDQFNMFIDAVNREATKYAINATEVQREDTLKDKPGAIWRFKDDPRLAIQMLQPNITSTNQLRAWQIVFGMINSMGGAGTIAEGQPGRNMPRAGGAVNNLVNLSLADIQDLVEIVEQEVLTPGLSDIYKVSANFIPDGQLMRIPGGAAFYNSDQQSSILKKQDIIGDYEFEWIGSLQNQEESMRAQRMLIFLNMVPQLQPMLMQQGYTFNIVELIQNIWRYSLGERSLRDVVMKIVDMQTWIAQQGEDADATAAGSNGKGVAGLSYNLPTATNGFVTQQ
jgi:hypothetical protein